MKVSVSIELIWQLAGYEAIAGAFKEIEPEHFLMALLKFADLPVAEIEKLGAGAEAVQALSCDVLGIGEDLKARGIDPTSLRRAIRTALGKGGQKYDGGKMHRAQATRSYFDKAVVLASEAGSEVLMGKHVLNALLAEPTPAVAKALAGCPAREKQVPVAVKTPALDEFGKEILVKKGGEPVVRLAEAKAVVHALTQLRRNSVLLETGSDTLFKAVLASVALLIKAKDAPECLKGKKIIDVSGIEFAGKMKGKLDINCVQMMMSEAAASKNVILVLPALESSSQTDLKDWSAAVAGSLKNQFVLRLMPGVRRELEKDPTWKIAQIITVQESNVGNIPFEL